MDLGSSLSPLFFMIYCIFPPARFCKGDEIRCLCPDIPFVNLTEAPPSGCFQIGARFRYKCKVGYKRQAGTSNLIKCTQNGDTVEWTPHNLKCKFFPPRSTGEPTKLPTRTETNNKDVTSPGLTSSESSQGGKSNVLAGATDEPAALWNTAEPSERSIMDSQESDHYLNSTHIVSFFLALFFLCGLVGVIYFCYKRRTSNTAPLTPPEEVPMNVHPPEAAQYFPSL